MRDHPEIETRRLRLRPLIPDYATALHEIYSDLEVMHYWHTPPHQSLEQTQALIASLIEGPARAWVLVPRDEETAAIGLSYFLNSSPTPGMGYILSSRHWRNGLMSEAITEIVRFGFEFSAAGSHRALDLRRQCSIATDRGAEWFQASRRLSSKISVPACLA